MSEIILTGCKPRIEKLVTSIRPGSLVQSEALYEWYSGGCWFDPPFGHIWATSWENLFWHMRTTKAQISLCINIFVVRCLDSIIPLVSISEIQSLYLAAVAAHAGLSLTWSHNPKTGVLVTRLIFDFEIISIWSFIPYCWFKYEHYVLVNRLGSLNNVNSLTDLTSVERAL